MTKEEREAIRNRCEAATLGPWMYLSDDELIYTKLEDGCRGLPITRKAHTEQFIDRFENAKNNAFFIAHARQDIPVLLDALEKAETRIQALERAIKTTHNRNDRSVSITCDTCTRLEQCCNEAGSCKIDIWNDWQFDQARFEEVK